MKDKIHDVIVIGAGPGGLTSALYASRSNLDTLVIGTVVGGQLTDTALVENYTGVGEVSGMDLADSMYKDALRYGATHEMDLVTSINNDGDIKVVNTMLGEAYKTKTIIVGVGTEYSKLGVSGEDKFNGKGVSSCFTCDAAFFKDQIVAVIGGGDSAVEGAEYLTQYTDEVYLIHRRDELRAEPISQERMFDNKSITPIWDTELQAIIGDKVIEEIVVRNNKTDEVSIVPVDGVFVSVGSKPELSFLNGLGLDLDAEGYVRVNNHMETNLEGIYAIGDVTTTPLKQISTAVGDGSIAGQEIYEYLKK